DGERSRAACLPVRDRPGHHGSAARRHDHGHGNASAALRHPGERRDRETADHQRPRDSARRRHRPRADVLPGTRRRGRTAHLAAVRHDQPAHGLPVAGDHRRHPHPQAAQSAAGNDSAGHRVVMSFWAAIDQLVSFATPGSTDWLLFAIDVVIIIASIWVAIETVLAMRRAYREPAEEPDADEKLAATRENV